MHKERNVDPVSTIEGIALRAGGGMQREKIMEKKNPISFEDDILQSFRKNIS